jgi:hypothetical protein
VSSEETKGNPSFKEKLYNFGYQTEVCFAIKYSGKYEKAHRFRQRLKQIFESLNQLQHFTKTKLSFLNFMTIKHKPALNWRDLAAPYLFKRNIRL